MDGIQFRHLKREEMKKLKTCLIALATGLCVVLGAGEIAQARDFDPGQILPDEAMYTGGKIEMNVQQIQDFLNDKGRYCVERNGRKCLKNYRTSSRTIEANEFCPATYWGSANESAAEIIYKTSRACNISPKLLLVTLQKEQSLITEAGSDVAYRTAMGYGCPDGAPCEARYFGLHNQIYLAAWQLQRYRVRSWEYNYQPGRTSYVKYSPHYQNPNYSPYCGGSNVLIRNQATASLYNYTPYQPNRSLLAGSPDVCSSYGNFNVHVLYTRWFGDPFAPVDNGYWIFTDVNSNDLFATHINWFKNQGITTGYGDGSFRPKEPVERAAMIAFIYRLSGSPKVDLQGVKAFDDVPASHPFYTPIMWARKEGITLGYADDNTFRPQDTVERAAMAAFIKRYAEIKGINLPDKNTPKQFTDIAPDNYFNTFVKWMSQKGITTGYDDGSFHPWEPVSREATAAFLYRIKH